ncbi:MAG: hypothetical protein PHU77_05610 [Simplicispira sp.]|nr:hypothetical protein [Simplicispira sp.]
MLEVLGAIGQVLGIVRAVESIQRLWGKWRSKPVAETLAGRFLRLFEAHGVHRNQIPRFFGQGLQLRDVQDEAALLPCLTDEHVASACQLFGVQRQWLERGEGRAHVRHDFYVQPKAFAGFLDGLMTRRQGAAHAEVMATLFGAWNQRDVDSTLVVAEPVGALNDEVIYRYHHVDAGPLGYWKARVSAAAMVAQALGRMSRVSGRNCAAKLLRDLMHNKDLTGQADLERLTARARRMEIEDWLLKPEALLEGVDPERHQFGMTSALEMWLKLDAEGWMKHPYAMQGAKKKFEVALKTQSTV